MFLVVTTYPSSVQCFQFRLAFLCCIFIPQLNAPEDALCAQALAVVHFHHNRGVTETFLQLSSSLGAIRRSCQHFLSHIPMKESPSLRVCLEPEPMSCDLIWSCMQLEGVLLRSQRLPCSHCLSEGVCWVGLIRPTSG